MEGCNGQAAQQQAMQQQLLASGADALGKTAGEGVGQAMTQQQQ